MAGVLLFDKSPNAFHISSKEAYGFGPVAIEPGYIAGINDGNCSFTDILTTSKTTSTPGAKVRSLPVTADTSTRNSGPNMLLLYVLVLHRAYNTCT